MRLTDENQKSDILQESECQNLDLKSHLYRGNASFPTITYGISNETELLSKGAGNGRFIFLLKFLSHNRISKNATVVIGVINVSVN